MPTRVEMGSHVSGLLSPAIVWRLPGTALGRKSPVSAPNLAWA